MSMLSQQKELGDSMIPTHQLQELGCSPSSSPHISFQPSKRKLPTTTDLQSHPAAKRVKSPTTKAKAKQHRSRLPPMAAARAPPRAPARVGLLYDERMCAHATPDREEHPENPERLRAIWSKLNAEGVTSRCVVLKAKEAEDKYIASVHSQAHIKLMKDISSNKYDSSRDKIARKLNSIYFNKGSSESALLAAGSVIEVAEKVAAGELNSAIAIVRPPGHHAEHGEAMGFCLFNNVAVAASYLLNERPDLGIKKILIVDWDVHHGNGTQKMFYEDPRILFFSVHRFDYGNFYPAQGDASHCFIGEEAGKGYNINVPWEHGKCGNADYIAAWDHVLLPVAEAFDPDIILVSAGFDAALGDPLGGCCITPNGYALLLTKLLVFAQGRIVMALEGGYNLRSIANSVLSCAKVLLGDKFTFTSPEMQPFESTWRVIQAVRDELKTCWPVLSSKLPENVLLRKCPSPSENEQLYAPSGSESDIEDVDDLSGAISSVNVIQSAAEVLGEDHLKMKLDEENLGIQTTSSGLSTEQHSTKPVELYNETSAQIPLFEAIATADSALRQLKAALDRELESFHMKQVQLDEERRLIKLADSKAQDLMEKAQKYHAVADERVKACKDIRLDLDRREIAVSEQERALAEISRKLQLDRDELRSDIEGLHLQEAALREERGRLEKERQVVLDLDLDVKSRASDLKRLSEGLAEREKALEARELDFSKSGPNALEAAQQEVKVLQASRVAEAQRVRDFLGHVELALEPLGFSPVLRGDPAHEVNQLLPALDSICSNMKAVGVVIDERLEAEGRELAEMVASYVLVCYRSWYPDIILDPVAKGPYGPREEEARAQVADLAAELASLFNRG